MAKKKKTKRKTKINKALCHYFYYMGALDSLSTALGSKNCKPDFEKRLKEFNKNQKQNKINLNLL